MLLAFADDTGLMSMIRNDMQVLIDIFVEACTELGLKINVPKTKFMVVNQNEGSSVEPFTIYGKKLEQVDEFLYLGSIITAKGDSKVDIRSRIEKADKAFGAMKKYIFKNSKVAVKDKMRCYQGIVDPIKLFGCEGWAL